MLEYDLDYQINVVNRECCPIPIIEGVAEITSIETKNNQIVYNISYDETILSYVGTCNCIVAEWVRIVGIPC